MKRFALWLVLFVVAPTIYAASGVGASVGGLASHDHSSAGKGGATLNGTTLSGPTLSGTVAGTPTASNVWSFSANGGPIRIVNNDGGVVQPTNITSFFGTNFSNGSAEADFFNGANRGSFPGGWEWYQWTGTATTYNRQMRLGGTGGLQLYNDGTAPTGGDCGGGCFNAVAARVQNDPVVTLAAAQTLTSKSLTSPNITGTATMGGNPTLSGAFNVDSTVSSTKACASGYTRAGPNFCYRNTNILTSPTTINTTCTSTAAPDSNAKAALLVVQTNVTSNNAVGDRSVQVSAYSDSGCTSESNRIVGDGREWVAVAASTVVYSPMINMIVPVVSGSTRLKMTATPSSGSAAFDFAGYLD